MASTLRYIHRGLIQFRSGGTRTGLDGSGVARYEMKRVGGCRKLGHMNGIKCPDIGQ
ncbi:MAG TPA: hypothetical protein VFB06_21210 [Streptosporangiaceae bacterium]|nr:hypothetical protein [Streptosporangiaceae bacterium]